MTDTPSASRLRLALELTSTVAILVAAVAVVWMALGQRPAVQANTAPALPTEPVSIAGAPLVGDARAPVTILEFSDFQCPYCARFTSDLLPAIRTKYIDTGHVRLAFRHFPLSNIHPLAEKAAEMAACAQRQGHFWELHDALFHDVGAATADPQASARLGGLDVNAFSTCLSSPPEQVQSDLELAHSLNVRGTPTLLVGLTAASDMVLVKRVIPGTPVLEDISGTIDELIAQHE